MKTVHNPTLQTYLNTIHLFLFLKFFLKIHFFIDDVNKQLREEIGLHDEILGLTHKGTGRDGLDAEELLRCLERVLRERFHGFPSGLRHLAHHVRE